MSNAEQHLAQWAQHEREHQGRRAEKQLRIVRNSEPTEDLDESHKARIRAAINGAIEDLTPCEWNALRSKLFGDKVNLTPMQIAWHYHDAMRKIDRRLERLGVA